MKKRTCFLLLFSLAIFFVSCKKYTPVDYPKGQIIFGSGGGFTGAMNEYVLLESGALFTRNSLEGEYTTSSKIERNMTKQMFSNIDFLGIKNIKLNSPGNKYYFIQIKDKNTDHKITWGGNEKAPDQVKSFYKLLNHLVKKKSAD